MVLHSDPGDVCNELVKLARYEYKWESGSGETAPKSGDLDSNSGK